MVHVTVGQFIPYQISPMSVLIHCKQMLILDQFPTLSSFLKGWNDTLLYIPLSGIWHRAGLGYAWGENACVSVFSMFTASVCTGIMLIYPEPLEKGLWNAIKPAVRGYHEDIYYLDHIRLLPPYVPHPCLLFTQSNFSPAAVHIYQTSFPFIYTYIVGFYMAGW